MAQAAPLMPKATAVWLVENTALSFDQIADFCKLHPLEVKAIADGDAAQGIKGLDPIQTGQLTREEIEKAEADPDYRLKLVRPEGAAARAKNKKGPRYTPVSRRQDRPNAILWLVRNHPELKDAQIMRLVGTTKSTIAVDPRAHPLERADPAADGPGDARPVLADRSRPRGAPRRQGEAGRRDGAGRDAAARLRDHDPPARAGGAGAEKRRSPPTSSTSMRCSPSSSSSAAARAARAKSSRLGRVNGGG